MALKAIFKTMKNEGLVIKPLEQYLLSLNAKDEDNDRAIDVNAPSQIGKCMRARYYSRMKYQKDGNSIDPRQRRIFDNGTHVHLRLQEYLLDSGVLLMDEVPIVNEEYNIQGHTDGLLELSPIELGVLELKSMKTESFKDLKAPVEHHVQQASTYMYCLEERRKYLQYKYKTSRAFGLSIKERKKYYESRYQHLDGGSKYTREEKIAHQVELHMKVDEILYNAKKPIQTVVLVYEDKNDQNLKELKVTWKDTVIQPILKECEILNDYCNKKQIPPRCARIKSDQACRWCDYRVECWG